MPYGCWAATSLRSRNSRSEWRYIAPGKPMRNGFVESFNSRLRVAASQREPVHQFQRGSSDHRGMADRPQHRSTTPEPQRLTPTEFATPHNRGKPRADDPGLCWHPLGLNGCAARKIFNRTAVSRRP
ncbi:hypothetical protein CWS35_07915 [Bradyrhizobium sp. SK17]|nr:hypothetical protein CWS35_07915 [Bradyrhizobium sp. SK17]